MQGDARRLRIVRWVGPLVNLGLVAAVLWPLVRAGSYVSAIAVTLVVLYLFAIAPAWAITAFRLRTAWATAVFWLLVTPSMVGGLAVAGQIDGGPVWLACVFGAPVLLAGVVVSVERIVALARQGRV